MQKSDAKFFDCFLHLWIEFFEGRNMSRCFFVAKDWFSSRNEYPKPETNSHFIPENRPKRTAIHLPSGSILQWRAVNLKVSDPT